MEKNKLGFKLSYLMLGFLLGLVTASVCFSLFKPGAEYGGRAVTQLKLAHNLPIDHPVHSGMVHFADRLAAYSHGRMQIGIFPNGQLGSDTHVLEQVQSGALDGAKIGAATLGSFIPVAQIFSLPFLFQDDAHYWNVLDGGIGRDLLSELSTNQNGKPSGFRGLTYYDAGSRNFYAKKAILRPKDLDRLKIRVMNDPVAIDMMRTLGASPTPISWGELYTALQQGVVDGAENNPPSFVSSRHFEVCKEFSLSHHTRIPDVIILSEQTWQRLSQEEQIWLQRAAADSSLFQRAAWADNMAKAVAEMTAHGVTLHDVDILPFMHATEPVRQRYAKGLVLDYMNRIHSLRTP